MDDLRGGEPERPAEHGVGLAQQLRLGAGLDAAQFVGTDAVLGDPRHLLVHRREDLADRDAGGVVHLGGEQRRVADVERVAEEPDVAALRDRDPVLVHQPALQP